MANIVYWIARIGLVVAWSTAAFLLWRRRHASPRFGPGSAILAGLFASMRAWPWNYWLLAAARVGLGQAHAYDDRMWFKVALAALLLVATVLGAWRLRTLVNAPLALACGIGLGMQGLLLAIETMSLDDLLPQCLVQQPGRYLAEGSCVTLTLVSLIRMDRRQRAASR